MSSTTIGEHIRLRRARNQTSRNLDVDEDPPLSHVVLPISQPNRNYNSAMSSFFLLPTSSNEATRKKSHSFPQKGPFRGMGCTASASHEVSVPSVIRSSADWDTRIIKDRKKKKKKKSKETHDDVSIRFLNEPRDVDSGCCVAIPDVWCGPGLGFSTDAVVDPPVVPRNLPPSRRKIDLDKHISNHREGSSLLPRRFLSRDSHSHACLNSDSMFMTPSSAESTLLLSRLRGHVRRPYADDLNEMMMLRNGFAMGRATDSRDHFQDLRLDVDSMSYEQLLELGDRIGYVNTGLKESEIHSCLRRINHSLSNTLADRKCSICQDEYEREVQVGKLDCGHSFHVQCVKQWLSMKNACPVCKKTAYAKH